MKLAVFGVQVAALLIEVLATEDTEIYNCCRKEAQKDTSSKNGGCPYLIHSTFLFQNNKHSNE